jgi:hypothetical protein
MIDMNTVVGGCCTDEKCSSNYCNGITNHLHVYLYKGNPQEDMKPLDPSPFLSHGSNEPPSAHDLPKSGQQACQTWSEKTSKCSLTSHSVEFRVSFKMEPTESQQTIYREVVVNASDVHRDEVSISNLAVLEDGDEMSEPVRRVAGNESLEFDTIVVAANTSHLPLSSLHHHHRHRLLFLLFLLVLLVLVLLVLVLLVLLLLLVLLSPLCLIVACRLMPTGGVNSPLLSYSSLSLAHETLTYYSAGSYRSHAQESARSLTEDTINQELMRLGLPNTAIIKAPSVVAWGGGSSSDKDNVVLVSGIYAPVVALLLFVCVWCYCWKKKKDRTDQSQHVEMQQDAGNVHPSTPAGIVCVTVLSHTVVVCPV